METQRPEGTIYQPAVPVRKDNSGLAPEHRIFAWVALVAGVIALVWWMARSPDVDRGIGNAADTEQRDRTVNTGNNR
jgi:hypothetical protein